MQSKIGAAGAVWLLCASMASALGPHEVAVLVNGRSGESVRIAEMFVKVREVPAENVIVLALPESFADSADGITPAEFAEHIWEPANARIAERGIGGHILAWVYSTKFPVVVRSTPEVSIQGITFVRNRLPPPDAIEKGLYASPLFAGPTPPDMTAHFPQSLDVSRQWLGDDMPLPSMMLGVTGPNGSREQAVISGLLRGVDSDRTAPPGTVWFVRTDDVRSKERAWQFRQATAELKLLDVQAVTAASIPAGTKDILGILMGARTVSPQDWGYLPGCMAEHLTSFGALFKDHNQTRLTAWLDAGATASAGTVTEPYARWTKFPSARFFAHYARGCCLLESLFQSIACPLQVLLVGEPLASPWKSESRLVLDWPAPGAALTGTVQLRPSVKTRTGLGGDRYRHFVLLADGKEVSNGSVLEMDTSKLTDGKHVLRVIGYGPGPVRDQVFSTVEVSTAKDPEGPRP